MNSHRTYLLTKQKRSRDVFEGLDNIHAASTTNSPPPPIIFSDNTKRFLDMVNNSSSLVDYAEKLQTDVMKLLSPKAGTVDKVFCFPINKHNETSQDGIKLCFGEMMESLQFVSADKDGKYTMMPNAKHHKVHFRVDALSSQNVSCLELNFIRQSS